MDDIPLLIHGPAVPAWPLVLDSPHSGRAFPADFGSVLAPADLRDGEDCFIDRLWLPAVAKGVPLLAAQLPRTYIDVNRHAADIDADLLDAPWPDLIRPSGKAASGKALIWRLLDDGRPIYARRLSVTEVQGRIARGHAPYHAALVDLLAVTHSRFGVVWHVNCHSMNPVAGAMGEGGSGRARADFVLGDRDGTTCAPEFTAFVRSELAALGYDVRVNDPFKGVELVRAYSDPARGRHSLQVEINKRLYMDMRTLEPTAGFGVLQQHLMQLVDALRDRFVPQSTRGSA
jgi:N-formylglutamate amidohydrolase